MDTNELKDKMGLKRCLFIENGIFSIEESFGVYRIFNSLKEKGVECRVVERANQNKKDVFEGVKWCDSIFFSSTFLHPNEIKGLGDLIKSVEDPKMIFGKVTGGDFDSLQYEMENIWTVHELAGFVHHRLFEIDDKFDLGFSEIDMNYYVKCVKDLEMERIERNKGFQKTGRKIKIKTIQASGKQWSNLKEGDIVDELDCTSIDPNPSRGAWVMGLEEPVKLLNDSGYEEWEYDDLKADALAREFFSRGSMLDKTDLMNIVSDWIKKCSGRLNPGELWEWCDNMCETVGVERRGNRSYFERRLKEYRGRYNYFKER